jgi:hypothetical protein
MNKEVQKSMAEEREPLVEIEGQKDIIGVPFTPLSTKPSPVYRTTYDYYLRQKAMNQSVSPLIGRYNNRKFQVYDYTMKAWVDRNYKDFEYEATLKDGTKQKKNYFKKFNRWIVQFDGDVEFKNIYNKATKKKETIKLSKAVVLLTKAPNDEMEKTIKNGIKRGDLRKSLYKFTRTGTGLKTVWEIEYEGERKSPLPSFSSSSNTQATNGETEAPVKDEKDYLTMKIKGKDGAEFIVEDVVNEIKDRGFGKDFAEECFKENYEMEDELIKKICDGEFD